MDKRAPVVRIREVAGHSGREVTIRGWLYNRRSSGKILFWVVRDGSGLIQCVLVRGQVDDEVFAAAESADQEAAVCVLGTVREDPRAPGGYEVTVRDAQVLAASPDYPISLKQHGVDFLMDHRHLWIRTPRQAAILRIRDSLFRAMTDLLHEEGFLRVDAPILTPASVEGTTTLFDVDYFGEKAYLSQSGQLYMEAAAMALGRVYCFGPTFRAEKSKTRRHLIEFWMLEPEAAFFDHEDNLALQEKLVCRAVEAVLSECAAELAALGRDPRPLERVRPPFPRITYDEALALLRERGLDVPWGEDFGAPQETALAEAFDRPVFVERFPARCKAFYMKPAPDRPEVVLCADLLAPEGYGEIIGGSQRIDDLSTLEGRLEEHGLPRAPFEWYLDLRRYGSVPHSGFGIGLERTVAWVCGLEHVREAVPFPRLLNRIYP
ncbi:MAG TPA: asparagine--tRNA ligase [Bacillota bacterium]